MVTICWWSIYTSLSIFYSQIYSTDCSCILGVWLSDAYDVIAQVCFGVVGQAQVEGYVDSNVYTNIYYNVPKYGVSNKTSLSTFFPFFLSFSFFSHINSLTWFLGDFPRWWISGTRICGTCKPGGYSSRNTPWIVRRIRLFVRIAENLLFSFFHKIIICNYTVLKQYRLGSIVIIIMH